LRLELERDDFWSSGFLMTNKKNSQDENGETGEIVRANMKRQVVSSDKPLAIYANDTQIQMTPWDVRLTFGVVLDVDTENGLAKIEHLADVRMSLQHAKRVNQILTQQLEHHERRIGPIAIPED
jgi:hypothetical protein